MKRYLYSNALVTVLSLGTIHHIHANVDTRGMSPELQRTLSVITTFVCDTGTKHFSLSRINDNYCDCEDGSDEPGTSACSHTLATYYCANTGYIPSHLPTSRVNDQLCDCCDGSDEYGTTIDCPNTCASLMETLRKDRKEQLDAYEQGRVERTTLVERAASQLRQDQARIVELRDQVDRLKQTMAAWERSKEQEEAKEQQEKQAQIDASKSHVMQSLGLLDLTVEQLGRIVLGLVESSETPEDLLRLVRAEREAGGLPLAPILMEEEAWAIRDAEREKEAQQSQRLNEERAKARGAREEAAETRRQEALDRGEPLADDTEPVQEEEEERELPPVEERPVTLLYQKLQGSTIPGRPEAIQAREAFEAARTALSNAEKDLTTLETKMNKIEQGLYGPDHVLYTLQDTCISTKGGEYTYSMCWLGTAKQDATSLGTMEKMNQTQVLFTGGIKCWNGPQRSLVVRLECGGVTELSRVEEPSTCVYTATLTTPIACDEAYKTQLLSTEEKGEKEGPYKPHHIEISVNPTL